MPQKKKKKRRLRWQIKLAMALIGIFTVSAVLYNAVIPSHSTSQNSTANTKQTQSDPSENQSDEKSLDGKSGDENSEDEEAAEEKGSIKDPGLSSAVADANLPEDQKITVLIDPGHGGFDPGNTTDAGLKEADINLAIAQAAVDRLKQLNPNLNVLITRTSDEVSWADNELDDLTARVNMQDEMKADYFISIHGNSFEDPTVYGYSIYVDPENQTNVQMADYITKAFEDAGWSQNQGVISTDQYPLQVVSDARIPAMLIEVGYMSNPEELSKMLNPVDQKILGHVIASGINNFLSAHGSKQIPKEKTEQALS